jgi:hypothetical protein
MGKDDELETLFREFRETVRNMAEESDRQATARLERDEASLEYSFHDGETGSLNLVLDYLDDLADKGPISLNSIEEAYAGLLLSRKRMEGSLSALKRAVAAMEAHFRLPTEEEMGKRR